MIWGFDIAKAKDEEGNEVTPSRTACVDEGIAVYVCLLSLEGCSYLLIVLTKAVRPCFPVRFCLDVLVSTI